jgi:hypothetical protein
MVVVEFVAVVVGCIVLVGEVGLPIYQANCLEAGLEGRYSEPTDTLTIVELQAL